MFIPPLSAPVSAHECGEKWLWFITKALRGLISLFSSSFRIRERSRVWRGLGVYTPPSPRSEGFRTSLEWVVLDGGLEYGSAGGMAQTTGRCKGSNMIQSVVAIISPT